ncbi:DNA polymerase-3 subunit epsilon [Modicisalibacter ilicicola DSM 19980]|uniref:Excinuclease cho n=1 Tax=Modicisalibacter ilicicola DSM 19980 TaxID=1121942 RepID=A0A1M5E1S4_9GAMM|nr:3'-5' exonuclease family protein [Halomonas ilicicola]SHF73218.1 DNA polymerase-3 subunit epsilon [Halomonas ilicicola DSM 19980]
MNDRPLVFIDLETTGTRTTRDRITEIAALRVIDGEVVDRYVSLVNPRKGIPAHIQRITGIDDAMVADAPCFEALANEFFAWLADDALVAHNARFDYGFLRNEFKRAGLDYSASVICTLKLSRRLAPQHRQHNLDTLLERHGLGGYDRHRAEGDTRAMLALWRCWQVQHDSDRIEALIQAQLRQASLPAHLDPARLQALPERPGVYLFHGEKGAVLYVGKSVNLRARVLSHFNNDHRNDREMRLTQQIHDLEWQETAGDLGAQLLEAQLIKELMPVHNRLLRRNSRLVSWCWPEGEAAPHLTDGESIDPSNDLALFGLFRARRDAHKALDRIAEDYRLCPQVLGLTNEGGRCFARQLRRCAGACCGEETLEAHTHRAREALERLKVHHWPWPGRVAFGETAEDGTRAWHVVDHWCYLGTLPDLDERSLASLATGKPRFDVDTYKILNRFLTQAKQRLEIRPLSGAA